jgi:hypothetical protein
VHVDNTTPFSFRSVFVPVISHQNKRATSNQSTVLFSQKRSAENKFAPTTSQTNRLSLPGLTIVSIMTRVLPEKKGRAALLGLEKIGRPSIYKRRKEGTRYQANLGPGSIQQTSIKCVTLYYVCGKNSQQW